MTLQVAAPFPMRNPTLNPLNLFLDAEKYRQKMANSNLDHYQEKPRHGNIQNCGPAEKKNLRCLHSPNHLLNQNAVPGELLPFHIDDSKIVWFQSLLPNSPADEGSSFAIEINPKR